MATNTINQIIRFFIRFVLILFILLICDRGIGTILKIFYFHQEFGERFETTYVIDSTLADILIFGSSRANHSYVPEVFEKRLPYTCYNAGRAGCFILYNYAIFKTITLRYNPKLIIFDITPSDLGYSPVAYERLSLLLPYYQQHPEIRPIISLRGPLEKIKKISAIYPFNSFILQIAVGNLDLKGRPVNSKGYIPHFGIMENTEIDTLKFSSYNLDENLIIALKDIISTCQQKNIDLVFVDSPIWRIVQDNFYKTILSELCYKNGILYLDMSNDPTFINNPKYFLDVRHLNDEGAKIFSNMVIDKIYTTNKISSGFYHLFTE